MLSRSYDLEILYDHQGAEMLYKFDESNFYQDSTYTLAGALSRSKIN